MRPILKYRGGKSREIPEFIRYIPNEYNRYIEPFLGGGAVYFYLEPEQAIINDINTKLIEFYQDVRNDFPRLQAELGTLQQEYEHNQRQYVLNRNAEPDQSIRVENLNEGLYYQMRDMFNGTVASPYLNGTLYYFINKTAYSGMIRYNRNGLPRSLVQKLTKFLPENLSEDEVLNYIIKNKFSIIKILTPYEQERLIACIL